MSEVNDKVVLKLQETLKQKKEELVQVKPAYNTNMSFKYSPTGLATNLHTVSSISTLVGMLAHVWRAWQDFNYIAEQLKVNEVVEFKHENFTFAEWNADIETRINVLNFQAKKAQYEALEKRLLALESDDLKASKELEAIIAILSK